MARTTYRVVGGCTWCTTCQNVCPAGAVKIDAAGAHIDPERCIGCGRCAANCPSEAIMPAEGSCGTQDKQGDNDA